MVAGPADTDGIDAPSSESEAGRVSCSDLDVICRSRSSPFSRQTRVIPRRARAADAASSCTRRWRCIARCRTRRDRRLDRARRPTVLRRRSGLYLTGAPVCSIQRPVARAPYTLFGPRRAADRAAEASILQPIGPTRASRTESRPRYRAGGHDRRRTRERHPLARSPRRRACGTLQDVRDGPHGQGQARRAHPAHEARLVETDDRAVSLVEGEQPDPGREEHDRGEDDAGVQGAVPSSAPCSAPRVSVGLPRRAPTRCSRASGRRSGSAACPRTHAVCSDPSCRSGRPRSRGRGRIAATIAVNARWALPPVNSRLSRDITRTVPTRRRRSARARPCGGASGSASARRARS